MESHRAAKIAKIIEAGIKVANSTELHQWSQRAATFLGQAFDKDIQREFEGCSSLGAGIGYLEGLSAKIASADDSSGAEKSNNSTKSQAISEVAGHPKSDKKIFIVHGHNTAVKESVARFIEKIGLESIILHEQPNIGRTVIEKFEIFSDVSFAVVLLTPDDEGNPVGLADKKRKRARQNVVLELGFFVGKLGRDRVCALIVDDVEMPSDYQGVVYVKYDSEGGWKTKLAQEFVQSGMKINLSGLL